MLRGGYAALGYVRVTATVRVTVTMAKEQHRVIMNHMQVELAPARGNQLLAVIVLRSYQLHRTRDELL